MSTLGDDFPREQARLRELLADYQSLGPVGSFGYMVIENVLRRADDAAVAGDVVAMISAYREMQECK